MDFLLPALDEDGQCDEETTPFDVEGETPDEEGDEAAAREDSDDEDPDV